MTLPLRGVRILDLSQALAGPYGAQILGDLGAEVIKIEPLGEGDHSRTMPPYFVNGFSAYFLGFNRNKKSLTLNLKSPEGKRIFFELVKKSDIVFDNFRPGVRERLGIDYEACKKVNPRIISCSLSGFGQNGPYRDRPALDLIIQAMGGAMSFTGEEGRDPVRMGLPMGDLAGGLFAVQGILAALYQREKSGVGQNIDISMLDCQIALLTYRVQYYFIGGEVPVPIGSGHASGVPIRAFKARDGKFVAIDAVVERLWLAFCDAIGHPELKEDPRYNSRVKRYENRAELYRLVEEAFLTKTRDGWMKIFVEKGVPAGPVYNLDEAVADPQVLHREMIREIDHPVCGKLKVTGNPIKMSESHEEAFSPQPALGEHNEEILGKLLGYSPQAIEELKKNQVI
ncbi:MAG: CoA transferase [Deltaproteobacteria bacterium]|nr:CoA transferase [Deltaproteobacteria bacterium]